MYDTHRFVSKASKIAESFAENKICQDLVGGVRTLRNHRRQQAETLPD